MGFNHVVRYVAVGVALVVLVSLGWRHRNDAWVQGLLRPAAPAKAIQFDNGSVRATVPYVPEDVTAAEQQQAQNNLPGILKKCVRKSKVVYTDQPCPEGFSAEQVSGDKVTVMESGLKPSNATPATPADPRKTLHDALDLSGNENLKDKMMERTINR